MKFLLKLLAKVLNTLPKTDWKPIPLCDVYYKYDIPIPNLVGHVTAPTVTTGSASNITYQDFDMGGEITDTNNENPSVRGFCYVEGAGGTPTTSDSVVNESGSFGTGTFSLNISGLSASTTYSVRAYATNSAGTGYGSTVEVTTAANTPPTVALNTPADTATNQSTTPTLEFTGTDGQGDDIQYNVQIDTVNTFDSSSGTYQYAFSNEDSTVPRTNLLGQSFTGGGTIKTATFSLGITGTPSLSDDLYARLYKCSSLSGTPVGSPLATSDVVAAATELTGSQQQIEFTFSGSNQYAMVSGEIYAIVVDPSAIDGTAEILVGRDASSPTHEGQQVYDNGSGWITNDSANIVFEVGVGSPDIEAVSGTDAGFANVDTPADTSPFNSGDKVDYDVQSADELDNSTTYYWRVRGNDINNSNTYGAWSSTRSFTTEAGLTISPNDISHSLTLDNTTITENHVLATNDISLSLTEDNTVLDAYENLEVTYQDGVRYSDNTALANTLSDAEKNKLLSDDNIYTTPVTSATGGYLVYNFAFTHDNSSDQITVTWKGKASVAPTTTSVVLQIYNNNSGSWETLQFNNSASADTEFTLTGSKTASLSDYYTGSNVVLARVYQARPLVEIAYADASVSGPTDDEGVWTNAANAFDGSYVTGATASADGYPGLNDLQSAGTNATYTGDIASVSISVQSTNYGAGKTLDEPSGGWTLTKLQNLEVTLARANSGTRYEANVGLAGDYPATFDFYSNPDTNIAIVEFTVYGTHDLSHDQILFEFAEGETSLVAQDISHSLTLDNTTITQNHIVATDDIGFVLTEDATTITQNHDLVTDDISLSPTIDTTTIEQSYNIATQDISHSPTLDTTTITQNHVIGTSDIGFITAVDDGAITQNHIVDTQDVSLPTSLDATTITQDHLVDTQEISHSLTTDNTAISQNHAIATDDIAFTLTEDATDITQNHILVTQDISHSLTVDTSAVTVETQDYTIITQDISHTTSIDTTDITVNYTLASDELTHSTTLDNTTITQNHEITTSDIGFITQVDDGSISQNHIIDTQELSLSPTVDTTAITQDHSLTTADIDHTLTADTTTISQLHIINTQDISLPLTEDNSSLDLNVQIIPDDTSLPLTTDNTTITQNHSIATDDIGFITTVDDGAISQNHVVATNDISHSFTIANTALGQANLLETQDISFTLTTDNTTITQLQVLDTQDTSLTPTLDESSITQDHVIGTDDIGFATQIDNVTLAQEDVVILTQDVTFGTELPKIMYDTDNNVYYRLKSNRLVKI